MNILISQKMIYDPLRGPQDVLEHSYINYFQKFANIVPLPNKTVNLEKFIFDLKISEIILSGGGDVDPKLYGGKRDSKIFYQLDRDKTEKKLIDLAIQKRIPLLAICRGAQFLNVYFGGKLNKIDDHVGKSHAIEITDLIVKKTFQKTKFKVNSFHNYGFSEKELSKELRPFAKSYDGVIEGIYHPKYRLAGILWHPERKSPQDSINRILSDLFICSSKIILG